MVDIQRVREAGLLRSVFAVPLLRQTCDRVAWPIIEADAVGVELVAPATPAGRDDGSSTLAEADRRTMVAALERADWSISGTGGAAEILGLRPTTLHAIRRPVQPSDGPD